MEPKVFTEDLETAKSILAGDEVAIKEYFYSKCAPLFYSIYKRYYTDCDSCLEFMHEIYLLILTPSKQTGRCQLENYRGESTLSSWLKTVCLFYCYNKFKLKERMPDHEPIFIGADDKNSESSDRNTAVFGSIEIDFDNLNRHDALAILHLMPNKRYQSIIQYRYLDGFSNEETAEALGMTMANYYNKHKLAKEQYERVWRKEVHHG